MTTLKNLLNKRSEITSYCRHQSKFNLKTLASSLAISAPGERRYQLCMSLYENVKLELYFYISIYLYIYIYIYFFFHKVQGFENITENTYLILKALEH